LLNYAKELLAAVFSLRFLFVGIIACKIIYHDFPQKLSREYRYLENYYPISRGVDG